MFHKKKKFIYTILLSFSFLVVFSLSFYQTYAADYIPLSPIPGTLTDEDAGTTKLPDYLQGVFTTGVSIAGVLAFLMIIIGGFQYMSTDAISGKTEGKERIMNAVGGLVLVLVSVLILETINPDLLSLKGITTLKTYETAPLISSPVVNATEYGKALDRILSQVDSTSVKARDIQRQADDIQARFENGDFESSEASFLLEKYNRLRAAETETRNFEQTMNEVNLVRTNFKACLQGEGPCQRTDSLYHRIGARGSKAYEEDLAAAKLIVDQTEFKITEQAGKLRAAGLKNKADELELQKNINRKMLNFWTACPDSGFYSSTWEEGNSCPD